jgi:hypothetical protein
MEDKSPVVEVAIRSFVEQGRNFLSYRAIADRAGVNKDTVLEAVKRLKAAGRLVVIPPMKAGHATEFRLPGDVRSDVWDHVRSQHSVLGSAVVSSSVVGSRSYPEGQKTEGITTVVPSTESAPASEAVTLEECKTKRGIWFGNEFALHCRNSDGTYVRLYPFNGRYIADDRSRAVHHACAARPVPQPAQELSF